MKLRAPHSLSSISHAGENIEVAHDGSVEVSKDTAAILVGSHGFTHWDAPSFDAATATREQLVKRVLEITALELNDAPIEQIRDSVIHFEEKRRREAEQVGATVEEMSRSQLFAYLRERGVAASPSMPNETLRDIARETDAKEKQAATTKTD